MDKMNTVKRRILREAGFLTIVLLLVALAYMISGTFFNVWINDLKMLASMAAAFYLIIGFYRLLNYIARKSRDDS